MAGKTDYQVRLNPVIRYLEKNFNQKLNLNEVAEMANLSPYHFHRIFKAVTGETLADFLRRLKLQQAAWHLVYKHCSVTQVALEHGFSSSQALAKAFRQYFGLSPSQIQGAARQEELNKLLQNSKIGHLLRKNGHANISSDGYAEREFKQRTVAMEKQGTMEKQATLQKQTVSQKTLAYIRVTGPYGKGYDEPSGRLYAWAGPNGFAQNECIFIYHDNPEITPAEKCRTDICLEVPEGTQPPTGIEIQILPAGAYACIREQVTDVSQYATYWQRLMDLAVEAGVEFDSSRPCFELYHSYDPQTCHADVSFYTAVQD